MKFEKWLDVFVDEKGLDEEHTFEVEGKVYGTNWIPLAVVLENIKLTSPKEQLAIQMMLIRLDFQNLDCLAYFGHLAQALAI